MNNSNVGVYAVRDRVCIARTGDIDGRTGTVLGSSIVGPLCEMIIVGLDEEHNGQLAIVIPACCLDRKNEISD